MADEEPRDISQNHSAEFKYYRRIIDAFDEYRRYSLSINNRRRKDFYKLPPEDQRLLKNYPLKLNQVDDRIRRNADVLDEIVFKAEESGLNPKVPSTSLEIDLSDQNMIDDTEHGPEQKSTLNAFDGEKVRSTLRQFVRDWSILGLAERQACYSPILDRLDKYADSMITSGNLLQKSDIRVLVPGSGLGRLLWEIANRGFTAQGNEISYQMLLASNLVLNHSDTVEQWSIFPFIHSFSNLPNADALLKEVRIPDVLVREVSNREDFGISVGEFTEIFSNPEEQGKWDAVVTCFFIDTAQNIVNYIRTIYEILKSNGIWINLGPTLWHYESSSNPREISIELDIFELKELCRKIGFEFQVDGDKVIQTTYAGNVGSNLQQVYHADYWVCYKREA